MKSVKLGARPKYNKPQLYKAPGGNEELIGLVQGIVPGSKEEYRVAVALERYKIEYNYQVPIRGGNALRGGQVVDFVVFIPWPTPLEVQGKVWHSGKYGEEETFKNEILTQYFGREPIFIDTEELKTQEQAFQTVRASVVVGS